jgi:hypothetical protein
MLLPCTNTILILHISILELLFRTGIIITLVVTCSLSRVMDWYDWRLHTSTFVIYVPENWIANTLLMLSGCLLIHFRFLYTKRDQSVSHEPHKAILNSYWGCRGKYYSVLFYISELNTKLYCVESTYLNTYANQSTCILRLPNFYENSCECPIFDV